MRSRGISNGIPRAPVGVLWDATGPMAASHGIPQDLHYVVYVLGSQGVPIDVVGFYGNSRSPGVPWDFYLGNLSPFTSCIPCPPLFSWFLNVRQLSSQLWVRFVCFSVVLFLFFFSLTVSTPIRFSSHFCFVFCFTPRFLFCFLSYVLSVFFVRFSFFFFWNPGFVFFFCIIF